MVSAAQASRARGHIESLMTDTCVITGDVVRVWNEETDTYDETPATIYTGMCELVAQNVQATNVDAQGQALIIQSLTLKLPVLASVNVREGHTVTMTVCALDPELVGTELRVQAPHHQTFATARRFPVKEVS